VLEKRLGIAQLCLLLAVLVFLSVTRGSPGEFHIPRSNSGSTDVTRGWGRRSLRLSGDWIPSRLRSANSDPPSASQGSHTPTTSNPIPRAPRHSHPPQTAPAAFLPSPSITPGPSHYHLTNKATTATTPTFRQKRPPLYLVTPMQHQHHHRIPRSRSTHALTRSRATGGSGGAASPTPARAMPIPVPLQRSSSYGAAFVGPVPRSARRWARSAHLHEVRRARHQHHPHHQQQQHHHHRGTDASTDVDEDVFAGTPAHRGAQPVAGSSFGRDLTNNRLSGGTAGLTRPHQKGEKASDGGGGAGAADTWVDTDTDADDDGDSCLCDVDAF